MKQEVAQSFLDTFHLKPDEVKVLRGSRDGTLDEVSSNNWILFIAFNVLILTNVIHNLSFNVCRVRICRI